MKPFKPSKTNKNPKIPKKSKKKNLLKTLKSSSKSLKNHKKAFQTLRIDWLLKPYETLWNPQNPLKTLKNHPRPLKTLTEMILNKNESVFKRVELFFIKLYFLISNKNLTLNLMLKMTLWTCHFKWRNIIIFMSLLWWEGGVPSK